MLLAPAELRGDANAVPKYPDRNTAVCRLAFQDGFSSICSCCDEPPKHMAESGLG